MALDASNKLSRLVQTGLTSGTQTVFTGTTGHIYTIKRMRIINPTGTAISVKLGIGGVADANLITPSMTIDAGGFAESDDFIVLQNTDTLQTNSSATGLTITVHGLDQS